MGLAILFPRASPISKEIMDLKTEWEGIHSSKQWGTWPTSEFQSFMACLRPKLPESGIKFLDLGCGRGANTWYLLRQGFQVYGIDISEAAIKNTHSFLEKEGFPNANLVVGNLKSLPYENETFDVAIDVCSLMCNTDEDLPVILSEISRVLKHGGVLFSFFRAKDGWLEPNLPFTNRLSEEDITNLFNQNLDIAVLERSERTQGHKQISIIHHVIIAYKKGG